MDGDGGCDFQNSYVTGTTFSMVLTDTIHDYVVVAHFLPNRHGLLDINT